jgi:hypothetical protein
MKVVNFQSAKTVWIGSPVDFARLNKTEKHETEGFAVYPWIPSWFPLFSLVFSRIKMSNNRA